MNLYQVDKQMRKQVAAARAQLLVPFPRGIPGNRTKVPTGTVPGTWVRRSIAVPGTLGARVEYYGYVLPGTYLVLRTSTT